VACERVKPTYLLHFVEGTWQLLSANILILSHGRSCKVKRVFLQLRPITLNIIIIILKCSYKINNNYHLNV